MAYNGYTSFIGGDSIIDLVRELYDPRTAAMYVYHDLRPMHHRSHKEAQSAVTGLERVAFLDEFYAAVVREFEELTHHIKYHLIAYDCRLAVAAKQFVECCGMVWFHA